jgi:subfamily B ATP-binding cassette protein MsbA
MERLFAHLLHLPISFFDRQQDGDLIETVRQDIRRVRTSIMNVAEIALQGVQAAAYLGAAVWLSPSLASAAFPILLVAALPAWWLSRRLASGSFRIRRRGYGLSDLLLQLVRGIRHMKVYAGEKAATQAGIERARAYFADLLEETRSRAMATVALETLGGLSIVIVTVVGGFQVVGGRLTLPALVAFLVAVRTVHGPLNQLNGLFLEIHQQRASVHRLRELMATRVELGDRPDAVPLHEPVHTIAFEHVSFGYPGEPLVLRDVTFSVSAGEQIGIVGASGAGKTTLVNLIARFYDPVSGRVLLNGRDLRDYRLADIYGRLGIVTQEPFILNATVADNIRYGRPNASVADMIEAAGASEIHDDIMALPRGYDTLIGTGARILSAGQMQRLNVARALLKNPPVLILDEATSSLDSVAERKVQHAIDRLRRGRTTFVVAHRLSTLRADRIIVLDDGQIAGLGPHEALLASCRAYRTLWAAQHPSAARNLRA